MGIIRTAFRKLLDHELGVVGDDLQRANDRLEDHQLKLEAIQARFELLQNRVGTRLTRAERAQAGVGAREYPAPRQRDPGNDDVFDDPFFRQ